MKPMVLIGRSLPALGERLMQALDAQPGRCLIEVFPDGEIKVQVKEALEGRKVFLLQSTHAPAGAHLLELLLLADACRRRGAQSIVAIVPYFGYARQDRRVTGEEPIGARLVADLLACRCDRIIAFDLHTPAIEGFADIPLLHLTAVPLLAETYRKHRHSNDVLVAPDAGAVRLANRYGELLDLPVAYVEKVRKSDREVSVRAVTGEVKDRSPVLVDDMISTGGTMVAAVKALLEAGAKPDISIMASHCLLVGEAADRLAKLPLQRILTTDSITLAATRPLPLERYSLAQILADEVNRIAGIPLEN
ncbi:MAG: ribose-phosphate pyrophosphokinase [Syntrophotaleaceae bacterium]